MIGYLTPIDRGHLQEVSVLIRPRRQTSSSQEASSQEAREQARVGSQVQREYPWNKSHVFAFAVPYSTTMPGVGIPFSMWGASGVWLYKYTQWAIFRGLWYTWWVGTSRVPRLIYMSLGLHISARFCYSYCKYFILPQVYDLYLST